jgi:hypothetical protein
MEANYEGHQHEADESEGRTKDISGIIPTAEPEAEDIVLEILTKRAKLEAIQNSVDHQVGCMSLRAMASVAVETGEVRSNHPSNTVLEHLGHLVFETSDPSSETSDPLSDTTDVQVLTESRKADHQSKDNDEQLPEDTVQHPGAYHVRPSLVGANGNTERSSGGHQQQDLVEANPVLEDPEDGTIMHANPVDMDEVRDRKQQAKKQQAVFVSAMILVCIAAAVILGSLVGTHYQDPKLAPAKEVPTAHPSMSPSEAPSSASKGAMDVLFMDLPDHTQGRILNSSTPQFQAWEWLSNHQNITGLPEWKMKQLFALATFFYAFEGENWNPLIKDKWMDDTKDECLWVLC